MAFDFVSNDTGSVLFATCTNKAGGLPINLTGASVQLRWKRRNNTIASVAMAIVTPLAGTVQYQFLAGELVSPSMEFEIEVTDNTSKRVSSLETIKVTVREQLG